MPKVSDEHRLERRSEIANAALRCFAEKGFQRTSMADIIAESGLSAGAIYGHFASKRDIIFAVAEQILAARSAEIAVSTASADIPSPGTVLRQTVSGVTADLRGAQLLVQLWGEATTDTELQEFSETGFRQLRDQWTDYLRVWALSGGRLSEDAARTWARQLTPILISLAQGFYAQSTLLSSFDPEAYFAAVDSLIPKP